MKKENPTQFFSIPGQPLPKPRIVSGTKWWNKGHKRYWDYLNSASEIVWAEMKNQGWKTIEGDAGCDITFYRKGKRRADKDNLEKSIYEILAKAKVVENDNQITEGCEKIFYNCDEPRVDIFIKES